MIILYICVILYNICIVSKYRYFSLYSKCRWFPYLPYSSEIATYSPIAIHVAYPNYLGYSHYTCSLHANI